VRSYSLPHREFWFDRPIFVPKVSGQRPEADQNVVFVQRVVDTVMGHENPDTIPGFIGSVNELEDLSGILGYLKRGLFLADWLLRDEGERDGWRSAAPDYEALTRGSSLSGGSVYRSSGQQPPPPSRAMSGYPSFVPSGSPNLSEEAWPNARLAIWPSSATKPVAPPPPKMELFTDLPLTRSSIPGQHSRAEYLQKIRNRYKDRLRLGDKEYPLVVKRVSTSLSTGRRKADAIYYHEESSQWLTITDDRTCLDLAKAVDERRLNLVPAEAWPNVS
jgi:hypothetical protein